jgi:hypothetical protein
MFEQDELTVAGSKLKLFYCLDATYLCRVLNVLFVRTEPTEAALDELLFWSFVL